MDAIKLADLHKHIGREAFSDWLLIDQARVNAFAETTGDHQWIHVDVERATRELGAPIVHGFLTLSLIPFLSAGLLPLADLGRALNYGSDKVRFMNMVPVGKRVRLRERVAAVEPKAGGLLLRKECTIEVDGEAKPALVAETLTLLFA